MPIFIFEVDFIYKGEIFMKYKLSRKEMKSIVTGEIALTTVVAICAIALMSVIIYKLFMSNEGSSQVPGGWKFTWK